MSFAHPPDLTPPPALVARDQRPWGAMHAAGGDVYIGCDCTYELDGLAVGHAAFFGGVKKITAVEIAHGWIVKMEGRSGE